MNGFLFDTSVLLDIATADPVWCAWSIQQLRTAESLGPLWINPVIYGALAPAFFSQSNLDQWLDSAVLQRLPLPYSAGWLAAQAFMSYRRAGGVKTAPLPDFFIGGHAEVEGLVLVTRDPSRIQTYFPSLALIAP